MRIGLDRLILLLAALAVLGAAHILVRTSTYGAAIYPDSVGYLSIAANLIAGEGLQDFRGVGLLPWPPLFPFGLAALGLAGIEPADAGRLVNALAFGLAILSSGLYLRRTLRSPLLVVGATVVVTTSVPLSHLFSFILSEPTFILFTLLALMQMESCLNRRAVWPSLVSAAGFSALAAVTRYPGVTVIFTGVLMLLLRRESPLAARLKHAAAYGAISSVPLAAVLAYNQAVFGAPVREVSTGALVKTISSGGWVGLLSDSLGMAINAFHKAMIPLNAPDWLFWEPGRYVFVPRTGRP